MNPRFRCDQDESVMSQEGIGVRLGVLGVRRVKDDDMKGEKLLEKIAELEGFDVFIYCIYI